MLEKNLSALSEVDAGPVVLGISLTSERSQTNNNFVVGISSWYESSGTYKEDLSQKTVMTLIV